MGFAERAVYGVVTGSYAVGPQPSLCLSGSVVGKLDTYCDNHGLKVATRTTYQLVCVGRNARRLATVTNGNAKPEPKGPVQTILTHAPRIIAIISFLGVVAALIYIGTIGSCGLDDGGNTSTPRVVTETASQSPAGPTSGRDIESKLREVLSEFRNAYAEETLRNIEIIEPRMDTLREVTQENRSALIAELASNSVLLRSITPTDSVLLTLKVSDVDQASREELRSSIIVVLESLIQPGDILVQLDWCCDEGGQFSNHALLSGSLEYKFDSVTFWVLLPRDESPISPSVHTVEWPIIHTRPPWRSTTPVDVTLQFRIVTPDDCTVSEATHRVVQNAMFLRVEAEVTDPVDVLEGRTNCDRGASPPFTGGFMVCKDWPWRVRVLADLPVVSINVKDRRGFLQLCADGTFVGR